MTTVYTRGIRYAISMLLTHDTGPFAVLRYLLPYICCLRLVRSDDHYVESPRYQTRVVVVLQQSTLQGNIIPSLIPEFNDSKLNEMHDHAIEIIVYSE